MLETIIKGSEIVQTRENGKLQTAKRKGAVSWLQWIKKSFLEQVAITPLWKNNRRKEENFSWKELSFTLLLSVTSCFSNQGYFEESK